MKQFKPYLFIGLLAITSLAIIPSAYSFTEIQAVKNNDSVFYLVALNESNTLILSCSSEHQLEYSVFLSKIRPGSTYKYLNGSYDPIIYETALVIAEGTNPQLVFTADETSLYYIQIIVYNKSSNLITINSNQDIGRYYLPLIDTYPLEIIGSITFLTIIAISVVFLKKRNIKIRV